MKTFRMRVEDVRRRWYHIDADGKTLGKVAVKAATILLGKDKPTFTPGVDTGDFVLVTNAKKVRVSGSKGDDKLYRHHTLYLGGLVEEPYGEVLEKHPDRVVLLAVRRMLPKSTLGRQLLRRLRVFGGTEHPHAAQKPETIEIGRPPLKVKS